MPRKEVDEGGETGWEDDSPPATLTCLRLIHLRTLSLTSSAPDSADDLCRQRRFQQRLPVCIQLPFAG